MWFGILFCLKFSYICYLNFKIFKILKLIKKIFKKFYDKMNFIYVRNEEVKCEICFVDLWCGMYGENRVVLMFGF